MNLTKDGDVDQPEESQATNAPTPNDDVLPIAPASPIPYESVAHAEQPNEPELASVTDPAVQSPAAAPTAEERFRQFQESYRDKRWNPLRVGPDLLQQHSQEVKERVLREAAEAQHHKALVEALRRAIQIDEVQQLHDAYDIMRTFGIEPEALMGQSRLLREMLNDQRFGNLSKFDVAAYEIERQWRQIQSGNALGNLQDIHSNNKKMIALMEKAERGEELNSQEEHLMKAMHLWPQTVARRTDQTLRALIAAELRRAQIPESPAMRKLGQAEKVSDVLDVLISHPGEILAVKVGQATAKTMATTAGTLLAGPYGGLVAAAFVTFGSSYAAALLEGFQAKGIDLQDKEAVGKLFEERKELIREIFNQAFVRAGIATVSDVASGVVGNMRLTNFQSKLWGGLAEKGAHGAAQVSIGVGGKIADGAASGKKPSTGQLVDGGLDGVLGLMIPEAKLLAF